MPSTSSLPPFMVCGVGGRFREVGELRMQFEPVYSLVVLVDAYETLKFALAADGGRMVECDVAAILGIVVATNAVVWYIKIQVKNLDSHRRGLIAHRDSLDTMSVHVSHRYPGLAELNRYPML
ncbi:hypothetical protein Tco_1181705 [Tanacetum coccineum]